MKIVICDDDAFYREEIRRCVEDNENKKGVQYALTVWDSVDALLESGELETCDVLFMDIQFEGKELGIRAAREIRRQNFRTVIILISVHYHYAVAGYRVNAFRFILKGDGMRADIAEALTEAPKRLKEYRKVRLLEEAGLTGYPEEVCYIESKGHFLELHLREEREDCGLCRVKGKLDDLEAELKGAPACRFLRTHKSFLVNTADIWKLERYQVILLDGTELPVPKNRYREIQDAYLREKGV